MAEFPCPHCQAPMGEPPATTCPACAREPVLCGKFRVTELLGRGGMGLVYGGRRETDGLPVAIKVLSLQQGADWKGFELFERSSTVLQQLRHEALPEIHGFERTEAGRLALVRLGPFRLRRRRRSR